MNDPMIGRVDQPARTHAGASTAGTPHPRSRSEQNGFGTSGFIRTLSPETVMNNMDNNNQHLSGGGTAMGSCRSSVEAMSDRTYWSRCAPWKRARARVWRGSWQRSRACAGHPHPHPCRCGPNSHPAPPHGWPPAPWPGGRSAAAPRSGDDVPPYPTRPAIHRRFRIARLQLILCYRLLQQFVPGAWWLTDHPFLQVRAPHQR